MCCSLMGYESGCLFGSWSALEQIGSREMDKMVFWMGFGFHSVKWGAVGDSRNEYIKCKIIKRNH